MPERHVHVLFVHGVGAQSRLSSLLRPYQTLRAETNVPEPGDDELDLLPGYRLDSFDELSSPARLVLVRRAESGPLPKKISFYEVNYSYLGGVLRENHPLNMTRLLLQANLAIAVGRGRLRARPSRWRVIGPSGVDHRFLADGAQALADVLAASTVPIVHLFPFLARMFPPVGNIVKRYVRFFEDVATYVLDKPSFEVVSGHFDKVADSIPRKKGGKVSHELVVVAHSLGSVVAHNYLVRNWEKRPGKGSPMDTLITMGSPIGLLCWLWVFLDFQRMRFDTRPGLLGSFFAWKPEDFTNNPPELHKVRWINAVNRLDPIATAFPQDHALLGSEESVRLSGLPEGVEHRFLNAGGLSVHEGYYDDRPNGSTDSFLGILLNAVDPKLQGLGRRVATGEHWAGVAKSLRRLQWRAYGVAWACLAFFLLFICWPNQAEGCGRWGYLTLLVPYLWPAGIVGMTAWMQKLIWGGLPVAENRIRSVGLRKYLPWCSPFRWRLALVNAWGNPPEYVRQAQVLLFLGLLIFVFHGIIAQGWNHWIGIGGVFALLGATEPWWARIPSVVRRFQASLSILGAICIAVFPWLLTGFILSPNFVFSWPGKRRAVLGLMLFSLFILLMVAGEFFARWRKVLGDITQQRRDYRAPIKTAKK